MGKHKAWLIWLLAGVSILGILIALAVYYTTRPREEIVYHEEAKFPTPKPPIVSSVTTAKRAAEEVYAPKDIDIPHPPLVGAPMGGPAAPTSAIGEQPTPLTPPTAVKVALTRKLIRDAWLTLLVQDVPKVAQQVRQVAEEFDGYVAESSQTRKPDGSWSAILTLRVPSENYHKALSRLQQLGQVDDLREQVQDVTEEFVDLEARLRNLKRSEQHLLELLKRTGKVSELLQVEKELSFRRQEIERLEGRLRYLSHQVDFSTIHVTLNEFRPRPVPETAFSLPKVFADAFRTVVLILRGALVVAVWVLVFGIIWVPLSVIGWFSVRKLRHMRKVAASGSE
ncbi:DUF4349 domain-containing protein [Fervidibacter sacchari]